jgi:hypothetical protein
MGCVVVSVKSGKGREVEMRRLKGQGQGGSDCEVNSK